ncbi:MAG TPA: ribulose-phosphate 3-epimerase [Acidimicrobiia bacterium]
MKLAPSLLAADFARLEEEVGRVEELVDWLHLDVMDGHFVPNLSFGMPVVASLRKVSGLFFDCHLMVTNPIDLVEPLAEAGADLVTMHIEAVPDPESAAKAARDAGLGFGLVVNPVTPFAAVAPYAELCDVILIMSVEPGFGGQQFIDSVLKKIAEAREWVEARGLPADIQVDGGITPSNVRAVLDAGATVVVAGSAIFGADDPASAVAAMRRAAE